MSTWYQRQFGDRARFALSIALRSDASPVGDPARDSTWGDLGLWVNDRCLTGNVANGEYSSTVTWNLLPILDWMVKVGVRLINEEPYPIHPVRGGVSDGAHWFHATLDPPLLDSTDDEEAWYLARSDWAHHHALCRAAEDVALPHVLFRRYGAYVEISWDNETWKAPRPGLFFVERRGCELVPVAETATVIRDAVSDVLTAIAGRTDSEAIQGLAQATDHFEATDDDWRWLVPRPVASIIRTRLPELAVRLIDHTARTRHGLHVPHTEETLALRSVRSERLEDIVALLDTLELLPQKPMSKRLQELTRPAPAAATQPWEDGNEHAERVRERMGWGTERVPDLARWLRAQNVKVFTKSLGLPSAVSVLIRRSAALHAFSHVNPDSPPYGRQSGVGLAVALGHLLLDDEPVAMSGVWEHWPTAARARAFGVALMLPADGVRETLAGVGSIDQDAVRRLMVRYGSGPTAATWRLWNLRLISSDQRDDLLSTLPQNFLEA